MAESWYSYQELLALAEAADGGLQESLTRLAQAVKPLDRKLRADEIRVQVARGYDALASRRFEVPWTPTAGLVDALGRSVIDIPPCGYDLSGAVILPGGVVVLEGRAYITEFRSAASTWRSNGFWGLWPGKFGFEAYDRVDESCVVCLSENLAVLPDDTPYFFFNSNLATSNFGHFVHDLLCQLIVYDHMSYRLGGKLRPLLLRGTEPAEEFQGKPFRYPMLKFLFEELVAPLSEVALVEEPGVRVGRCYAANLGMPDPATLGHSEIAVSGFSYARSRLVALAERHTSSPPSYPTIYVSRRDAIRDASREFHNLDEAEKLISGLGFQSLTVGRMSVPEILAAFCGAEHIAGIHGAGLVNFMFAPRLTRLTELTDYPYSWPSVALIGASLGVDVRRVEALPPATATGGLPSLDLSRIGQALSRN
jgi:Glycosyltransferase 61